jgi:hypothetical protein
MRYRKLSPAGDFTFGRGQADFLIDSAETVAQAVTTRLRLMLREWFLDLTEGTPYLPSVLGAGTTATYDNIIKQRILGTPGVTGIQRYTSSKDPNTRALTVEVQITTNYGTLTVVAAQPAILA